MNYISADTISVRFTNGHSALFVSNDVRVSYAVGQSTLNVCHQEPSRVQGTITIYPLAQIAQAVIEGSR